MSYHVRIAIREQLASLVLFAVLIALAVVSVPTWIYVNGFVVGVEKDSLSLAASLKATRIASEIALVQTTCQLITTRILIQDSLQSYYQGNTSASNWVNTAADLQSALGSGSANLYQVKIYSRNTTGSATGLYNATGYTTPTIRLPYDLPDGSPVYLGDDEGGYPPSLYPNITYVDTGSASSIDPSTNVYAAYAFPDVRLSQNSGLLLGPLIINDTFALMSLTVPIRSNNGSQFILGYMTIVASASTIVDVTTSREGMGASGVMLIIGPTSRSNRFNASQPASNATYVPPDLKAFGNLSVHFVLPPQAAPGKSNRHISSGEDDAYDTQTSFPLRDYPAAFWEFSKQIHSINNASAALWTHNEEGKPVSVGYARPQNSLVNWTVIVEQERGEALAPINTLRTILLGCTFGTAGFILLLVIPCAHWSVMPIRRLKAATEKSIAPPGYQDELEQFGMYDENGNFSGSTSKRSIKGFIAWIMYQIRRRQRRFGASQADTDSNRRIFKIPGKVENRTHFVTDELTELTEVFNEMSDELLKQYKSLDRRVQERTRELEISKKAAEAANESKTLFIANISHELKTPLNGIMGMCAVCMEEDDIVRIKQSLKTLYKSGDLLLHLLEDLLSFSKNQIGHQINLEEREFRLGDIRSQVLLIFDKQVREGRITLSADFIGTDIGELADGSDRQALDKNLPAVGPPGVGRLKDMCLWGDQHRILQIMINLVSNSCKFTPPGGKVMVRIRCIGEVEPDDRSRASSLSRTSGRPERGRHRLGSGSHYSTSSRGAASSVTQHQVQKGTALVINPTDPRAYMQNGIVERPITPPPPNAKTYMFEFEIEDTGPGIPDHMQQRVFEPFVQGDLGLSRKFGGTGLGLSICSQLATLMGGNISLRSTVGVGTTFIVQIPLKYTKDRPSSTASSSLRGSRPASVTSTSVDNDVRRESLGDLQLIEASKSAPTTAPLPSPTSTPASLDKQPRLVGLSQPFFAATKATTPQTEAEKMAVIEKAMEKKKGGGGKLRVLVADDNNTNIEVVSRMLKLESVVDVTIAKDGQEAFELVKANFERNERFDVIFMDIQMPNLDGLQSTRLIRQMGYKAPIVALTAFSDASNVKDCMDSGMNEFLAKPIRRPALKQVLQRIATIPEEPETASIMTRKTTPDTSAPPPTQHSENEKKLSTTVISETEVPNPSNEVESQGNGVASSGKGYKSSLRT
ncbi:putative histidine kinase SlnCl1 [Coniella lustricola]|uniref:histidine kinase n=1 Tax=Coniella lustricola TaxID=2025994 RepID=A0A2T3AFU5_9PEZI|nr:putative histidine kinase SlnCl1 [Coniella lustricola]